MENNNLENAVFVWTAVGNVYIFSSRDNAEAFIEELEEIYGKNSEYSEAFIVHPYDRR